MRTFTASSSRVFRPTDTRSGLYPQWLTDVQDAGFGGIETFSFDVDAPYSHEGWRGRIRASAGVGATLAADAVERFDAELARILAMDFPAALLQVPHRVWAVVCRSPTAAGDGEASDHPLTVEDIRALSK